MIKHIVFWKLHDQAQDKDRDQNAQLLKQRLEALKEAIPQIRKLEAGINFNESDAACDVALYTEFESREDLDAYQVHPKHVELKEFVGKIRSHRFMVDYET